MESIGSLRFAQTRPGLIVALDDECPQCVPVLLYVLQHTCGQKDFYCELATFRRKNVPSDVGRQH